MLKLRNNQGLTLIELIITIAVGSLVTLAATTVLLLGLRIYNSSNGKAMRQNEVRVAITVMERLAAEAENVDVYGKEVLSDEETLLKFENGIITTGAGATILEGADDFVPGMNGKLLTIKLKTDDEEYEFSVYCRVTADTEAEPALFSRREQSPEEILTMAIDDEALTPAVRAFLKILASQVGSGGRIQTENGEGEYYSSWYIGGYEGNPGWSAGTPWCACFISWALDACREHIQDQPLKFANVDKLWAEFVTTDTWKSAEPEPGDVIFFDWNVDGEQNPEHVGIVFAVENGWIYTIEGNSNNAVKLCKYSSENPYVLGYGTINWN